MASQVASLPTVGPGCAICSHNGAVQVLGAARRSVGAATW